MKPTPPKMSFFLQRIALIIFSFLPIGLAIYYQLLYLSNNWTIFSLIRIGLLVAVFFFPLIVLLIKDDVWHSIEEMGYVPLLWVTFVAIALRLIVLPLLSTNFSSDMADIHAFAVDVASGQPFANLHNYQGIPRATHLNMTGLVMSVIYRIVGASFATAKTFMVVLVALTVWLIYLAGKQLAGARVGFIAASIYGTFPSLVCYSGVLSGEHFSLPLMALAILLYGRIKKSEKDNLAYSLIGYALCGITIGLVDWFRPGGIILLVALVITDLIYLTREKPFYHQLVPLGLLIISYFAVSSLAVTISERFFHTDILSTFQMRGNFIFVGLSTKDNGTLNLEDGLFALETYKRFGDDTAAANDYLIKLAIERLRGQPVESVLELFQSKFMRVWSNHQQLFQISLNGSNDQEFVGIMSAIDSFVYLVITLFIGINIYSSFLKRSQPGVFAMQLFLLGFAIWELILEVQNRYGIITFPYLILLGSLGMNDLMLLIHNVKRDSSLLESVE
jgi:4-amino-4-deoxy-L-arabinose transferase-like glycosyltransferase